MKAQVSMEFITFVGILTSVVLITTYASAISGKGINSDNNAMDARRIAELIGGEINIAEEIGTGYSHKFELPEILLGGSNYSVNLSGGFVYVFWNNKSYSIPVLAYNITGSVNKGAVNIRNNGGVILLD